MIPPHVKVPWSTDPMWTILILPVRRRFRMRDGPASRRGKPFCCAKSLRTDLGWINPKPLRCLRTCHSYRIGSGERDVLICSIRVVIPSAVLFSHGQRQRFFRLLRCLRKIQGYFTLSGNLTYPAMDIYFVYIHIINI